MLNVRPKLLARSIMQNCIYSRWTISRVAESTNYLISEKYIAHNVVLSFASMLIFAIKRAILEWETFIALLNYKTTIKLYNMMSQSYSFWSLEKQPSPECLCFINFRQLKHIDQSLYTFSPTEFPIKDIFWIIDGILNFYVGCLFPLKWNAYVSVEQIKLDKIIIIIIFH